ncbi:MAG: tetratricopeptide repeat protein, partial [Micromonosporaceae bacterium]
MSGSHIERAELLADLGRYQEAAEELSDLRPDDVAGYTLLSRIRLASGDLRGALAAADMAVAAAPDDIGAQVARGMALADLGRVDEAAEQAERLLRHGSADGYACTSAAAILAQVRNGQVALDAAWQGVRLSPDQPRAHLVLGVVAAGLGLSDIAARAYREALELDPRLPVPQAAAGIVRTEQQRYVSLLSRLTGETPTRSPGRRTGPVPPRQGGGAGGDRARRRASGPDGGGRPRPRGADAGQGPARPPGPAVERDLPSGRRVGDPGAGPGRGAAPGARR